MIQIFGYCRYNLGDDLFIQTLLRRYPNKRFYMRADPRFLSYLKKEPNLCVCSKLTFNASRVLGKLNKKLLHRLQSNKTARREAAVRIGGSVFIERGNASQTYFPEKNKRFFIIGANFGPFTSRQFLETRRARISESADCCFRDTYSYHLFSGLSQVRYAPDVLFGCPFLPKPVAGDFVGVSVIDFKSHPELSEYTQAYEDGIIKICDHWTSANKTVKLLGFCEGEGDADAVNRIVSACKMPNKIQCVIYRGNTVSFLDELNSCETIYATRFHAMILGWALYKNVVPIIYSEKQTHVIDDIGFSGDVWDVTSGARITQQILSAENGKPDPETVDRLKSEAAEQFRGLDAELRK